MRAAIACDDVTFERETRVGSIKDVVIMGVFFARETERVAGNRYAQRMNRWGGYGGKLHGPTKLELLYKGVISWGCVYTLSCGGWFSKK